MSEIIQHGFRELWVVSGPEWTLPIFCDPYTADGRNTTHWAVSPALEMLVAPFTELSTRFSPVNLGEDSRMWVVGDADLRKIAQKASGCVPRDYMNWTSDKPGVETKTIEIETDSDKDAEFLKFVCSRYSIDLPLGRFVWRAIKEGMLHWFKNSQKPIDMEILVLHPIPFRANWKEIMLSKHSDTPTIFRKQKERQRSALVSCGFIEDLGSTDLLAVNKNKTFSWTIEVEMKKLLMDELEDGERTRIETKKPARYAKYYESSIRRRLNDIIEIYAAWLKQIEKPVGAIRESMHSGSPVLVPESKRHKVLPSWHRPGEVTFQPATNFPTLKPGQPRKQKHMEKALKDMFKVPNILPRIEDMRGLPPTQNVDGPGNNGDGAGGVRVHNVGEIQVISSKLLVEGEKLES